MLYPAKSIQVLDLFSGIGGFSLALKGLTNTVAYCEKDAACRHVLAKNHASYFSKFSDKTKNKPLLIPNVTDITHAFIKTHPELKTAEMITAGFPCTDISSTNIKGKGLEGEFSGLFYEIMRILDILPQIKFVFLENSPVIRTRGLDKVIKELNARHFSCLWTYVNASDVGAHHKRKRWYCFCFKTHRALRDPMAKDLFLNRLMPVDPKTNIDAFVWRERKDVPRIFRKDSMTFEEMQKKISRCKMLGNSVVPQCAAHAWNILVDIFLAYQKKERDKIYANNLSPVTNPDIAPLRIFPIQGYVDSKHLRRKENVLNLVFDDGVHRFTKDRWATPNYSIWHMFRAISSPRCETTFTVQVLFEKDTHIIETGPLAKTKHFNKYIINPHFIEHLMGYPKNWTLF